MRRVTIIGSFIVGLLVGVLITHVVQLVIWLRATGNLFGGG